MAGITPDPKKRGYLLPPGCKDLYDVLPREIPHQPAQGNLRRRLADAVDLAGKLAVVQTALRSTGVKPPGGVDAEWPLGELAPLVSALIESRSEWSHLMLTSPEPELKVSLSGRKYHLGSSVNLHAKIGTERNEIIREFCQRHRLPLPEEGTRPPQFRFDAPVYQLYRLDPVPPGSVATAGLVRKLFEEVAGLTAEAPIHFRCVKF